MGTTDKATHYFTCPTCNIKEETTLLEKGSNWGASWSAPSDLDLFVVDWKLDRYGEPQPITSKCRSCGSIGVHSKS